MNGVSPSISGSWIETIAHVAEAIASYGQFNFLLSDGDYLIAYAHDRLHYLERQNRNSQMETVDIALIGTEPLASCTSWLPFESGELRIYRQGRLVGDKKTHPPVPSRKIVAVS